MLRVASVLSLVTFAVASVARGQIPFIGDFFKRADNLNLNYSVLHPVQRLGLPSTALRSYRFEALFLLQNIDCAQPCEGRDTVTQVRRSGDTTFTQRLVITENRDTLVLFDSLRIERSSTLRFASQRWARDQGRDTLRIVAHQRRSGDTTFTQRYEILGRDTLFQLDSVRVDAGHGRSLRRDSVEIQYKRQLEIALGYGQVLGIRSRDSNFTLRGSLEEFPVVSLYYTKLEGLSRSGLLSEVVSYWGLHFGLVRLSGMRAYLPSDTAATQRVYTASATSYLLGGTLGVAAELGRRVDLFAELGYTLRRFSSVEWSSVSWGTDTNSIPGRLPKVIQLNTLGLTLGLQLDLKP